MCWGGGGGGCERERENLGPSSNEWHISPISHKALIIRRRHFPSGEKYMKLSAFSAGLKQALLL